MEGGTPPFSLTGSQAPFVTPVSGRCSLLTASTRKSVQRWRGLPGGGAGPGQPPAVSQQRESEALGKGHVHLGCVTKV